MSLEELPATMFDGELRRILVKLKNVGGQGLTNLQLVTDTANVAAVADYSQPGSAGTTLNGTKLLGVGGGMAIVVLMSSRKT